MDTPQQGLVVECHAQSLLIALYSAGDLHLNVPYILLTRLNAGMLALSMVIRTGSDYLTTLHLHVKLMLGCACFLFTSKLQLSFKRFVFEHR